MQEALLEHLAADLDGCFEQLVRSYQDRLYRFALRLTGDPADAEEVTQDAFVRGYRALTRFKSDRILALKLRPWLYQITLNVIRNRFRGRRLEVVTLSATEDGATIDVPDLAQPRPEDLVLASEDERDLGRILASLPMQYRAAVTLRHVEGLSYAEAAELLGKPIGTVKANVHRGLRMMRAALAESTTLVEVGR